MTDTTSAMREALEELVTACERDAGIPSEDDGDDETVGWGQSDGVTQPMALTFGMMRRARAALTAPAQADIHATMETAAIISWLDERQRVLKQWLGDNPDVKILVVSRSEIRSEIAKLGLFSKAIAHSPTPPRVDEKEMP